MSMDIRINKCVERDVVLESKRKEHLLLHRRSSRATMRACYRAPLFLPPPPHAPSPRLSQRIPRCLPACRAGGAPTRTWLDVFSLKKIP